MILFKDLNIRKFLHRCEWVITRQRARHNENFGDLELSDEIATFMDPLVYPSIDDEYGGLIKHCENLL